MRLLATLGLAATLLAPAAAQAGDGYFTANYLDQRFCAGMTSELRPGNAIRIQCSDDTHAIVVEFQDWWPEAIGQALSFAAATGLQPGIVLVCRNDGGHCTSAATHIEATLAHFAVPLTLWNCLPIDQSLADCGKVECDGTRCI